MQYQSKTNVSKTLFGKTKLNKIDFSKCNIEGIITYTEDLKGCFMNENQALSFIKILGINITEK